MAEETRKRSVVIADGTYRLENRRVILRTPAQFRESNLPTLDQAAETSVLEEAIQVPPPPSAEEIARENAEKILEEARREADSIRRQASEQGYAEGLKEGVEQGKAQGRGEAVSELREALDRWLTMGDALTEAWRNRFEGFDDEMKDLAVVSAERLVEKQLELSPETIVAVIKDSLRHAAEADSVTLLVSPKDVALVRAAREDLAAMLKGTGRFDIQEDPKVAAGGCLVVTKTQLIDATNKTRSDIVRDSMRKVRDERAD
jgi:flagellar biosynthesis/type III secretory pathway protein FliH